MKELQIDSLRDFAIEHLPRAQAVREQAKRFSLSHADYYNQLAFAAVQVRASAATTAFEYAAAEVLEVVSLLRTEHEEPLSKSTRSALLQRLASHSKELCSLTGKAIPWLDSLLVTPELEPELDEEQPKPAVQKSAPTIAGRHLTTKEAAEALDMQPQTLLKWASTQTGPIQPCSKVGREHRWSGDEIFALLNSKKT